jgi:tetratricopeptide (TPR) repeat protein
MTDGGFKKPWLKSNALQKVREGQLEAGIREYKEYLAVEGNDQDDDAWAMLGGAHRRSGQLDASIACYAKAAALNPASTYAAVNLATLRATREGTQALQDDLTRAMVLVQQRASQADADHWTYFDLGMLQTLSNRLDEARASYQFGAEMKSSTPAHVKSAATTLQFLIDNAPAHATAAEAILKSLQKYLPTE